ncbi:hypothetical protein B7463_g11160, partial [Scytalidium lignicola]
MARTKFYGSQVGGNPVIPHSYTGSPLQLLRDDIRAAFSFMAFMPFIVWPLKPTRSGPFCELYPSTANLYDLFLHLILIIMQVPFILSIPFWIFFPVWSVLLGVTVFFVVYKSICKLLNGKAGYLESNPEYAKERDDEKWIFMNGVAVGHNWLQSNIDRLSLTFGRHVTGVHNSTDGIIFDVIQCLIQRNFNYATNDIRAGYKIVKETLYNPKLTKVVFILHSQGGIEGGMIIDWLLQEVPQDLLAKLEVYTFGNAANHFNNPHQTLLSEHASLTNPRSPSSTHTTTKVAYHDTHSHGHIKSPTSTPLTTTTAISKSTTLTTTGKTLRHIEHYAHTSDFVARWGVLHFTCNYSLASPAAPRFMGRVFERQERGHQFNQHYLDGMFPLKSAVSSEGKEHGIGGSGFSGADEDNEFMNTPVELGIDGDENCDRREGFESSYCAAHGSGLSKYEQDETIILRDMSPISPNSVMGNLRVQSFGRGVGADCMVSWDERWRVDDEKKVVKEIVKEITKETGNGHANGTVTREPKVYRVKDLSRLWLYRNGRSPMIDEVDIGIARMATL